MQAQRGAQPCPADPPGKAPPPQGERAVGQANAVNPLPILIPCHRVVGSHGELTGFGGGLEAKAFLLRLEHASGPAAQLSLPLEEG